MDTHTPVPGETTLESTCKDCVTATLAELRADLEKAAADADGVAVRLDEMTGRLDRLLS